MLWQLNCMTAPRSCPGPQTTLCDPSHWAISTGWNNTPHYVGDPLLMMGSYLQCSLRVECIVSRAAFHALNLPSTPTLTTHLHLPTVALTLAHDRASPELLCSLLLVLGNIKLWNLQWRFYWMHIINVHSQSISNQGPLVLQGRREVAAVTEVPHYLSGS